MEKTEHTPAPEATPASPIIRRWPLLIGIVVFVIVIGIVTTIAVLHGRQSESTSAGTTVRTAKVERTSLVAGFALTGTLGYGKITALGGGGGVVTKVPEAGQTVDVGSVIMEVEGAPVFLLQGALPLWRDIVPGVSGVDVAMLRSALTKVGIPAGTEGAQDYDQPLSDAIAQLYAKAGYQTVPLTDTQKETRKQAQTALTTAQAGLTSAQATLDAARNRKPSQAEQLSADAAINQARLTYEAALRGECPSGQCTQAELVGAQDALNIAIAQRDDLLRPPDTTMEQLGVNEAQRAVEEAQAGLSTAQGNTVGPQTILMVPEAQIHIDNVTATLGMPATGSVLTWTRAVLYGHVDLTDAQRKLLSTGVEAVMTLPDGTEVPGEVAEITESRTDPQTQQSIPANARIDITDQATVTDVGPSAITVTFVQDTAEDTLVVPVTALMALAEGGYCVELLDGTLIAVEVGLVADTRAQIFSDQLAEGDEVIVP